jgi:hypothetical protein
MDTNTHKTTKKWLGGAFIALAMALAGTLLLPNPVVLATNSYINNIHFYVDDNGLLREHFFVLQDITQTYYLQGTNICWATTS